MLEESNQFFSGTDGLHIWQIILASVFVALGYPVASAIAYALFSKVIAPLAQGDKMGYLTAGVHALSRILILTFSSCLMPCFFFVFFLVGGSLARMIGPIWATALFDLGHIPSPIPLYNTTTNMTVPAASDVFSDATIPTVPPDVPWGVAGYPGAWMFLTMVRVEYSV